MSHSSPPPTTHTLEMAQIDELNHHLTTRTGEPAITAATLGMAEAPLHPVGVGGLPGTAALSRLSWQGSPEFPDIYGHFGGGQGGFPLQALLHTAALHQLCHQLHVRQRWGIGPPVAGSDLF